MKSSILLYFLTYLIIKNFTTLFIYYITDIEFLPSDAAKFNIRYLIKASVRILINFDRQFYLEENAVSRRNKV